MTNFTSFRVIRHGEGASAWNMAVDEALLREVSSPVVRFYGWGKPDVTIGYFQPCAEVPEGRGFVRRYTGGGLVDHREDLTYTLVFPRDHPMTAEGPNKSYEHIHSALAKALSRVGVHAALSPCCLDSPVNACFVKPVKFDVMLDGRKIAGAAQRRTREGSLHQGSILHGFPDKKTFVDAFIGELESLFGASASLSELSAKESSRAGELDRDRYSTKNWNEMK